MHSQYCVSTSKTRRFPTREVRVGSVGIGGNNPIRIQSMTTSNTRDVDQTVEQITRLSDTGCEIARVTVQGIKEAESCEKIKDKLLQKGYTIPLVADIHFYPPAALKAAEFVDKIRINPGNFIDKRASFKILEYTDASYAAEIEKIEERFVPLIEKCKQLKRAMRIGTNHGSLSDRIMNRYGDTPKGMVESALEFARICRKYDYHQFVFSMKSSNPQVMILAYRLLAQEMLRIGWDYPLHLGVTEAGAGEDGRIKSAVGIGSLLLDGLGDTIRVSLTEDPWQEIDPCKRLIRFAQTYERFSGPQFTEQTRNIEALEKREVLWPQNLALHKEGSVFLTLSERDLSSPSLYPDLDCGQANLAQLKRTSVDGILYPSTLSQKLLEPVEKLTSLGISTLDQGKICTLQTAVTAQSPPSLQIVSSSPTPFVLRIEDEPKSQWTPLLTLRPDLIFFAPSTDRIHRAREFFDFLKTHNLSAPVILQFCYAGSADDLLIEATCELGSLLCDELGEGVCIEAPYPADFLRQFSFNLLQAARRRVSKTEFISCPSCGRTLFDLQEVSARIRAKTAHLPGVKIAIMGCIVNGPGEMADAHFGYVGSQPGKVDLYVGKRCIEKNIPFATADERLIALIKQEGAWVDPPSS